MWVSFGLFSLSWICAIPSHCTHAYESIYWKNPIPCNHAVMCMYAHVHVHVHAHAQAHAHKLPWPVTMPPWSAYNKKKNENSPLFKNSILLCLTTHAMSPPYLYVHELLLVSLTIPTFCTCNPLTFHVCLLFLLSHVCCGEELLAIYLFS